MTTAVAATARRSRRPSQNQPPTDKGLDVAAPDGSDNDGNGKQKKTRPALPGLIMTRSAFNKRIQESCGLDVVAPEGGDSLKKRKRSAQNDGDGKQKESSAFKQQQVKRKKLVREEKRRIEERRGFDFEDVPPMDFGELHEPCWAEKSLYPAPKVYEDMTKIGLKSYNCQYDTSYQFTKILRVYFCKSLGIYTDYEIYFQAEDKSVASPENFRVKVCSFPSATVISFCRKLKDSLSRVCRAYEFYIGGERTLNRTR